MKRTIIVSMAFLLNFQPTSAQDLEFTTYYGERKGFRVEIPDEWIVALDENAFGAGMIVFDPADSTGTFILLIVGPEVKNWNVLAKDWRKFVEKQAKKNDDTNFVLHGEGKAEYNDKKCSWVEYEDTLIFETGESIVQHQKHYFFTKGLNGFHFRFQSRDSAWEKMLPVYDYIINSFKIEKI